MSTYPVKKYAVLSDICRICNEKPESISSHYCRIRRFTIYKRHFSVVKVACEGITIKYELINQYQALQMPL
jgi:hypothetical protein